MKLTLPTRHAQASMAEINNSDNKNIKYIRMEQLVTDYQRLEPYDFIENFKTALNDGIFKTRYGFDKEKNVAVFIDQLLGLVEEQNNPDRRMRYFLGQEFVVLIVAVLFIEKHKICRSLIIDKMRGNNYVKNLSRYILKNQANQGFWSDMLGTYHDNTDSTQWSLLRLARLVNLGVKN